MIQQCVCRDIEQLGSLESTQKTRVALGCASSYSYASFVLCKLPACSIYTHADAWTIIINLSIALLFSRFSLLFCLLFRFLVSFRNRYVICLSYFSVTLVFIKSVVSIQKSLYIVLVHSFYNHNLKAEG